VLVCSERIVLLAGCWWLVCSERKVLLAGVDKPSEQGERGFWWKPGEWTRFMHLAAASVWRIHLAVEASGSGS
jgi:hypothetical protein